MLIGKNRVTRILPRAWHRLHRASGPLESSINGQTCRASAAEACVAGSGMKQELIEAARLSSWPRFHFGLGGPEGAERENLASGGFAQLRACRISWLKILHVRLRRHGRLWREGLRPSPCSTNSVMLLRCRRCRLALFFWMKSLAPSHSSSPGGAFVKSTCLARFPTQRSRVAALLRACH